MTIVDDQTREEVSEDSEAALADRGETVLEFRIKRFVALALFERASSVVPRQESLPVLKNFRVDVRDSLLQVVATDLELSVVARASLVETLVPGSAVFPAAKILEIMREAVEGEVDVRVTRTPAGALSASVIVGSTSWTLRLQTGDDYPALPEVEDVAFEEVDRSRFLGAIQSVRYAASTELNRANLTMLDITGGCITACDGSRLQQARIEGITPSIQVPIAAVDDLVRLLRTSDLPTLGIGESPLHIVFRVGSDVFIANKLMAQFPDVERSLLRPVLGHRYPLSVDHEELAHAVRRVRINADPETCALVLDIRPGSGSGTYSQGSIEVRTLDKFGNASTETVAAVWGEDKPRTVVVHHKFLAQMLDMHEGRTCAFRLGDDTARRPSALLLEDPETGTRGIVQQMVEDWVVSRTPAR